MTTATAAPEITVLGWTDDHLDCDVCGKPLDRERTLAYTIDGGPVQHAGTVCAAKIGRTTVSKIRTAANEAERAARQAAHIAQANRLSEAQRIVLEQITGRTISGHRQRNTAMDEVSATFESYADRKAFMARVSEVMETL
jgi:hypothetical protein